MKRIQAEGEISSIILDNDKTIYSTYNYENNIRTGGIFIENNLFMETSGTFQIAKFHNSLFAANSKDIVIFKDSIIKLETSHMNTCFHSDDYIYVGQSNGLVTIYDYFLNKQSIINICGGHIIWCVQKLRNYLLCGCDCGNFIIYDTLNNTNQCIKRKSGITCIFIQNEKIYVGGYDSFVVEYDFCFKEIKRNNVGNVWRIVSMDDNKLALACMYDGVKIVNIDFKVIEEYATKSIAYGLDFNNNVLVFSDFYEKCFYRIEVT